MRREPVPDLRRAGEHEGRTLRTDRSGRCDEFARDYEPGAAGGTRTERRDDPTARATDTDTARHADTGRADFPRPGD